MREQSCCFTGHRELPREAGQIASRVERELFRLIQQGVRHFLCGGAIGFDLLCGQQVLKLKERFPSITLHMVLPYPDQAQRYTKPQKEVYTALLEQADEIVYMGAHYTRGCMHRRNRYMVEHSAYAIVYCIREEGGSYYTACYAQKKHLNIIPVGQEEVAKMAFV